MKYKDCYVGQKVGMSINGDVLIGVIDSLNNKSGNGISDENNVYYGVAIVSFQGYNASHINVKYLLGVVK